MYETGSASGVVDLITKLEVFMAANGWTTDSFANEGSGKRFHAHNGSVFFNARAYVGETPDVNLHDTSGSCTSLAFNLSTAGTGGTRWFDKTGSPLGTPNYISAGLNGITGAVPTYHFFAQNSGASILVVVEHAGGYFQHFGFGTLNKYGTYTGGQYMFGSRPGTSNSIWGAAAYIPAVGFISRHGQSTQGAAPALISLTVDAETGWHWSHDFNGSRDSSRRYVRCNHARYQTTLGIQPNSLNDLAVLMPVECTVARDTVHNLSTTNISPIGELPGVHYVSIADLTPGQQIVLGSDEYRVFPFYHKDAGGEPTSNTGSGHSGFHGFAVKE